MHSARPATLLPPAERPGLATGRRILLIAVLGLAAVAAMVATPAPEAASAIARAGPELTRLLRAMALLKLLFAGTALAAVLWRLGSPIRPGWFAAYAAACCAMLAGPVLIWEMADVRLGAVLLHGGLLACGVLLWRDPAVAGLLDLVVKRRRAEKGRLLF